jgi:hypothetical protein
MDKKNKNLLERTKTYLIGHMQYKSGRDWRKDVTDELQPLGITVFDPYHKPFVEDVDEDEPARVEMLQMMEDGKFDDLTRRMKKVRNYDLNLVDRSDFIIGNLQPEIASWGSAEEIVTAVREQKPLFIAIEGGKTKTPLWMLAMFPHKYIYNSIDEVIDVIKDIDSGKKRLDSGRWKLLKKEYR